MPARTLPATSFMVRAWTSPARAIALGRVELDVVGAARRRHAPAGDAPDDLLVVDLEGDDGGELAPEPVERLLERLGLRDRAGEAVEEEAVGRCVAREPVADDA